MDSLTFFVILSFLFYFLPTIVGIGKDNIYSIFALNLLLGWTFIGWVIALIWALKKDEQRVIINNDELNHNNSINEASGLENKKCPDCAELIKIEAKVCRFCGLRFD